MEKNADGYDSEPMSDASYNPFGQQKSRKPPKKIVKTTVLPAFCPPLATSPKHTFVTCDAPITDTTSSSGHIHPCFLIDQRVLKQKLEILQSLHSFVVVQKNQELANSLHTFELLIKQLGSAPKTPIAETVVAQIDGLQNAIYQLESTCSAASTLYLSHPKSDKTTCMLSWEALVIFATCACFFLSLSLFEWSDLFH